MRPGLKADDKQAVQIITRYMCRFCGRQFDSMGDMQNHTQMHFSEKPPHSCYVCGRTYRTPSKLQRHVRVHSGERPYSCQICGKRFTRSDHVKQHMKVHLPQCQKNVCRLCGMRFMRRQTLQAHLRSHGYHQVFSCNRCGEAFESAMMLHQHKTTHEPDAEPATAVDGVIKQEPESPDDTKPIVGLAKFGLGPQPDVKETIDGHYTSQSSRSTTSKLKKMLSARDTGKFAAAMTHELDNDIEAMARSSMMMQQENGDIDDILKTATAMTGNGGLDLAQDAFKETREYLVAEMKKREITDETENSQVPSISISDCYSLATEDSKSGDATNEEDVNVTGSTLTDGNRMILVPPSDMMDNNDFNSDHSGETNKRNGSNEKHGTQNGMDDQDENNDERKSKSPGEMDADDDDNDDDIIVKILPKSKNNRSATTSGSSTSKLTISCLPSVPRLMKPPRLSSSSATSTSNPHMSTFLPTLTKATPPLTSAPAFDLLNQRSVPQVSTSASPHLSSAYLPSSISALDAPITGRSSAYLFGKKMLRCDHCSIWFEDQSMSMLHMSLHSADESDPFTCKKCLKRLGNRLEFMAHIVWHLDPHMDDKLQVSYNYI
ncbi:uncharacterized protein LOC121377681 [Gigantopelta aegis]|uniref:uncharacterized protein LOC121377681 n=1 Tax=Gigantopelta aegis TaxID=1735272 RepID=UPI001B88D252|nr:uncharacterized protein LOC121377681 [Gigantopelta aegis]